ncbi:MAG: preprotein translocase subunit SecG [Candidatus Muproteobacteria bacterium RIFCSPHIGHO2_01_FULL_65_16]|uniref:Protein-export membrane protein SecG n=2 Tax=Candidatus Muproteobacteria TaxID=1817795 RepID=A0A1F6TDJ9_9PROT|nr:MAG: preprotein translocase subunit SecG [Candidatus Muproteobacteria bacterium RBG_16_65_31]OGI47515.1 MAG: preprotein translocase subunit SecG [Candidatus Muproteobacteria bacterium RIFCSPHIGHO2_01_FULL_65_16]
MKEVIMVIDIVAALGLVGLVLLQQGKGADMGAAFGSGASATLFGARGSANFLTRTTAVLAAVFFIANLALAWMATHQTGTASVTQSVTQEQPAPPATPAVPDVAAPPKAPEVPK